VVIHAIFEKEDRDSTTEMAAVKGNGSGSEPVGRERWGEGDKNTNARKK